MTDAIMIDRQTSYELQGFDERHQIKEDRKPTNVPYIAILVVVVVVWISNAIYVLCNTKLSFSESWDHNDDIPLLEDATTVKPSEEKGSLSALQNQSFNLIGAMMLNAFFILAYLALVRKVLAKVIVYIGMFFIGLLAIVLVAASIALIVLAIKFGGFMILLIILAIPLIFLLILIIPLIQSAENVGIKLMTGIVKESCRTILHHPTTLLFALAMLAIEAFIYKLGEVVIICTLDMDASESLLTFLRVVNVIGGFYVYYFVSYFGYTVIATSIATCHWSKNREEPTKFLILSSISRTARFHLGSVSFGATRILPFLQGLYLSFRTKCDTSKKADNILIRIYARILLTFDVSSFALIQTSIDGSGMKVSYAKIFQLVSSNSSLYLIISSMKMIITYFVATLAFTISSAITQMVLQRLPTYTDENQLAFSAVRLYLLMPFYGLLYTSTKTILLCTMLDLENQSATFLDPTA